MPRPGITYMEVVEAAEDLIGQGKNPTIEQIRLKLGSGSSTTISNHLRAWRDKLNGVDMQAVKDILPHDLISMVKGLWERVVDQSQEKIVCLENQNQQTITELEQTVSKYKTNNRRWQMMHQQWMEDKAVMQRDYQHLANAYAELKKENDLISLRNQSYLQKIQEQSERIDEWRDLHASTQHQFVLLENDMQAQFKKEQEMYQDQVRHLRDEIVTLQQQQQAAQADIENRTQQLHTMQTQYALVSQLYVDISDALQSQQALIESLEHQQDDLKKSAYYWEQRFHDNMAEQADMSARIINVLAENKRCMQQLEEARQHACTLENELTEFKHAMGNGAINRT